MNKKGVKIIIMGAIVSFGMFFATLSAGACWLFGYYQKKCPESLIIRD